MDRTAFVGSLRELGLEFSEAQLSAFEAFEESLFRANEVMNLTRVPRAECWLRHFVDSLLIAEFIPDGASVLDIGTGPGFPAWPLACARPDLKVCGLDSSGKMMGFLRSQPLPNLSAVQARAEDFDSGPGFDVVTGRALAPLGIQLELSAWHVRKGGLVIPMRTNSEESGFAARAISRLGLRLLRVEHRPLPGTDVVRSFPIYERIGAAPKRRTWAEVKRSPLF